MASERIKEYTVVEPPHSGDVRMRYLVAAQLATAANLEGDSAGRIPEMELGLLSDQQVPKPSIETVRFLATQVLNLEDGTMRLSGQVLGDPTDETGLPDRLTVRIPADAQAPATASMPTR